MTETADWKPAYERLRNQFTDPTLKQNALALFALKYCFGDEQDLVKLGAEVVTDGPDDKGVDIFYLNKDNRYAVIAQCYYREKEPEKKQDAPSKKSDDLNTAMLWLLKKNEVPPTIRSAAEDLRDAIDNNEIDTLHIWYVHNLPSKNGKVVESLRVVAQGATAHIRARQQAKSDIQHKPIAVIATEVGDAQLSEWYARSEKPILVSDKVEFTLEYGGYEMKGDNWKSYVTSLKARELAKLRNEHKTDLLSANVRDYLGSRNSDSNVNNGIIDTIKNEPNNFWIYNNGITILTHQYQLQGNILELRGMSIVNGGQTTGTLAELFEQVKDSDIFVPARIIEVNDSNDLISSISRYNNKQNKVMDSDFRSTDEVQKRLVKEFKSIPNASYNGGRRGNIKVAKDLDVLHSDSVAQVLCAFHGDPVTACNKKPDIWKDNKKYILCFNDQTTAKHIIFCYGLMEAIAYKKLQLIDQQKKGNHLTSSDTNLLEFLKKRGAIDLSVDAISTILEDILKRTVSNKFELSFGDKCGLSQSIKNWKLIIEMLSPFFYLLNEAINEDRLTGKSKKDPAIAQFQAIIKSNVLRINQKDFDEFDKKIEIL